MNDLQAVLDIMGSVKIMLDTWGITPWLAGFLLIGIVAAFIRHFSKS